MRKYSSPDLPAAAKRPSLWNACVRSWPRACLPIPSSSSPPGGTIPLSVSLTAPTVPGTYAVYWSLKYDRNETFGLPVHVTEIDVDLENVPGTQEECYALQAQVYGDMLSACLESGACQSFSVWGFGDKYSFLERYNDKADATLYDDNLDPKPAYFTLLNILHP